MKKTKLQNRLDNLIEMRADCEISKEQFKNKSSEIKKRIQTIENELSQIEPEETETAVLYERDERLALFKSFLWQTIYVSKDSDIPDDIIRAFVSRIIVHEDTFDWYLRFMPENSFETLKPIGKRETNTIITPFCLSRDRLLSAKAGSNFQTVQIC